MEKVTIHGTIEAHVKVHACGNCKKRREDETLRSEFAGKSHYVTWNCSNCGQRSYWKTKQMSSGVKHAVLTNLL